jgi:oligoendopeptidase F
MNQLTTGSAADRRAAIDRYLTLLQSGGSDHPMTLLQRAGVDLGRPEPVRAVVKQLDSLVSELESSLKLEVRRQKLEV